LLTLRRFLLVLSVCIFVIMASNAHADVTGFILGTVTDPSGAVVPGATVKLSNPDTGLQRTAVTSTGGDYEFLAVPVGVNYSLTVEAPSFRQTVQSGMTLQVNQRLRVDVQLEVGQVAETVNVNSQTVQVETTNTQLGDVIDDRKMTALPLNGRSYLDLLGLQAGVSPLNATGNGQPVSGNLTTGQVSVNGQRENTNSFMVNGGTVEDRGSNGASIVPTLDSIQEFRLLTNSFDAEYGHFSGAIVNAITKSGTNSMHGTLFEFLRNDKLDARNFFANERGVFRRNQFGFAAGGPIIKNRLFFFSDYQGTREAEAGTSALVSVPSIQERSGDFSDVGTTGFAPLTGTVRGDTSPGAMASVLTQRLGYTVKPGEPYWVPGCDTASAAMVGICVFPNEVIPKRAMSPAALGTLGFIPLPTGTSAGGQPFFSTTGLATTVRDDKLGERVDLATTGTGNWAFYYHFDDATVGNPYGQSDIPGFASQLPSRAQQVNMSNTKIFGPTAVNELRLNYVRVAYPGNVPTQGLGKVSTFGFTEGGQGLIPANPAIEGVPQIYLNQLGVNFGSAVTDGNYQNTYQLLDGFSKIVGRHTLKFGGSDQANQWNRRGGPLPNGQFQFNGGETGNDFADFLLGAPDVFIQSSRQFIDARSDTFDVYGQDSFHVLPNLTINYGLRWEVSQPWSDTQNRIQAFIPGQQSTVFPNSPTGWLFPGDKGIPSTLGHTRYDNFAPRFGIAYAPSGSSGLSKFLFGEGGKTSIRAGAGTFYTIFDTTGTTYETGDAPFGFYYVSPTPIYLETPYLSRISSSDNPGQRFPFVPPVPGSAESFAPFQPIAYSPAFSLGNKLPYAIDLNFTIQRQFGKSTIVTVGYVGTIGRHLFSMEEFNPGNAARCLEIRSLYIAAGQPGGACGPYGEDTIYKIDGQTFYGTRPYSVTSGRYLSQGELDFGDNTYESTIANSDYHSFQATVNKSMGPLRFLAAYTFGKSLDDASAFGDLINPFNNRQSRALSAFDITSNFVASYSYSLPFQHLNTTGFVRALLSNWDIAGITRFSTGLPVTLFASGDTSLCGCEGFGTGAVDTPNYNGQPVTIYNPRNSGFQYFDTSPFSYPQLGNEGTANRRFFHGPGLDNTDLSLVKGVRINERFALDIRAEFFNAFNHAQFNNPTGNLASSTFGRVTSARDPRIGQLALKVRF